MSLTENIKRYVVLMKERRKAVFEFSWDNEFVGAQTLLTQEFYCEKKELAKIKTDAEDLKKSLLEKNVPAEVYIGMHYWDSYTEEADRVTKLVVLPLYPQFSISTSGLSLHLLESIFREDEYPVNMQDTILPSWYQREGYIKAIPNLIEKEMKSFDCPKEVMIFISAHGVPLAYVEEAGDPYKAEMEEYVKAKINNFLKVPFFHHEIVKRPLIMVTKRRQAETPLLNLLKEAAEGGFINTIQMSKGLTRLIEIVDDLSLDIPNVRAIRQQLMSKATSKGDIFEVNNCLEQENNKNCGELNAIFVKKLIALAMDRKNRKKEMASVLFASLCFPPEDVLNGFVMLIKSADDTALDNHVVVEDLAMFLARSVVD